MMIDFHLPRTKPSLQEILTDQYINRYGNGVAHTIGGKPTVDKMQKKRWDERRIYQCLDLPHIIFPLPAYNFSR